MSNLKIGIVTSRFNEDITSQLHAAAIKRLKEKNIAEGNITSVFVPGAVEIPLAAQHLASQKKYDAIICLGAVIRGDTDHYDYVCQQVSYGVQRVALDHHIPVTFGVLTTEDEAQAQSRVSIIPSYVDGTFEMIELLKQKVS